MEGDARCGFAVVLDPTPLRFGDCRIRRFVAMMREGRDERGVFGMRLRVVPTNLFVAAKDGVAVIEELFGDEIYKLTTIFVASLRGLV